MKNTTINREDERYKEKDRLIRNVLLNALSDRRLTLRPKEVCEKATITRPTFYAHCVDMDDALRQYEAELETGFSKRLPRGGRKGVVFTILLGFINDEKDYFGATLQTSNFYLLNSLLSELKPRLGYQHAAEKHYEIYAQRQIALICCWGKFEDFERCRIPFYVNKMTETEIMDCDL